MDLNLAIPHHRMFHHPQRQGAHFCPLFVDERNHGAVHAHLLEGGTSGGGCKLPLQMADFGGLERDIGSSSRFRLAEDGAIRHIDLPERLQFLLRLRNRHVGMPTVTPTAMPTVTATITPTATRWRIRLPIILGDELGMTG